MLFLELNVAKFSPLLGSGYVKLPSDIEKKRAVVNVQNYDNMCFVWAILAALYPAQDNPNRITNYRRYLSTLNLTGIEFPIAMSKIKIFEKQNPDISINVFGLEKHNGKSIIVGPYYYTQSRKPQHINLLYLEDDEGGMQHYCWIKNLGRLVNSQISKRKTSKFICDGCLQHFGTEKLLLEHMKMDCNKCVTVLPSQDNRFIKFNQVEKQIRVPFVIYSDFEALLVPIQGCKPNNLNSFTVSTHLHKPYSFAYYIKCSYDDSLSKFQTYRGEDCAKVFCEMLTNEVKLIYNSYIKNVIPMKPLSSRERENFDSAQICYLCETELGEDKVHDHCHLTGKYRGACHNSCNLRVKTINFIPVFLHNLTNYDCHLFIKELASDKQPIDVIPVNKEKYISFSKKILVDNNKNGNIYMSLRFLDSFRFMSCKLETLAQNLTDEQCIETRKFFVNENEFRLTRQKGVFPYSYVDSIEKLNERQLPSKSNFYDSLQDVHIADTDYERAQNVWNTFSCNTLGDYSDIYLKVDVILLSDVFENFRNLCISTYNLDPCQFFTLPGLSFLSMLKFTKVELELLTDITMVHFLQKNIRGGFSGVIKRFAEANNPYIPSRYNKSEPTKYIMYWDANNLYGYALSQCLPISDFQWLSQDEINNFNLHEIPFDSERGFILEVDIQYPKDLHEEHNNYPFCVEKNKPPNSNYTKLIQNLYDKHRYVTHYKNLKQCLENGLQLIKIYRILSFKQTYWMKPFIEFNTRLRQNATNQFDKDMYKLINNANYGKSIENVEKRVNVKLINSWKNCGHKQGAEMLISKPNFHSISIFNEDFVAVQMLKSRIYYNKPIYAGFTVLELAKYVMYEFHYNFIKQKFGSNATLLYTDTDSFLYEIESDNVYEVVKENLSRFDTSNYNPQNIFQIPLLNKAVPSLMKDEACGKLIWEFAGLRAKTYEINIDGALTTKSKGVRKNILLTDKDFKSVLNENKTILKRQNVFRSLKHFIHTQTINKVALSAGDDKRFLIPNSYNTLAWGHYKIPFYEQYVQCNANDNL